MLNFSVFYMYFGALGIGRENDVKHHSSGDRSKDKKDKQLTWG